jgi:[protein-PII] uridylyltransferase
MGEAAQAAIIEELKAERARIKAAHEQRALTGVALSRALSDSMERAVVELWKYAAGDEPQLALIALGGFARGELSPFSDVDLMVLHAGSKAALGVTQQVFYPLWDAGFIVGHATRTVKDCMRLARASLEAETSFLQPRLIAGDVGLFDDLRTGALAATRRHRRKFVDAVHRMVHARHEAGGSATSQLEPNLKDGSGGLRDLNLLGWFEQVEGSSLEERGLIGSVERRELDEARELILQARTFLHYAEGRAADVLSLPQQRPAALAFGYADDGQPAEDTLMRDVFTATRAVEQVTATVIAEMCAHGSHRRRAGKRHFAVEGGRVIPVEPPSLDARPEVALEPFALGVPLGAAVLAWLDRELDGVDLIRWTEDVQATFSEILRRGEPAALEAMDHAGVLARLLPEWSTVRCRAQRNPYHRFTVDAHQFHTVGELVRLPADPDQLIRDAHAAVADLDVLLLAGFLHDVGKGAGLDHAAVGEAMATQMLVRMNVGGARAERVTWLVRHHLMLVEAATRRDLNVESFIVDVADRIGDTDRARMLFLLSVADARATGPLAWTTWKAALVRELFVKVTHVIERGELVGTEARDLAERRIGELHRGLARYPSEEVETHIARLPRAYVLAFPSTSMIRHFALMDASIGREDARAHVAPGGEPGVYECTFAARDRPGLFSIVCGTLALNGINIVSVQAFTRADGIALQVYRCTGAFTEIVDEERWSKINADLKLALAGTLDLRAALSERRATYEKGSKGITEPDVIIDLGASDFATVIEVHADDRLGILFEITGVLAGLDLDIRLAKAVTAAGRVVDVFYVCDLDEQKVTAPARLGAVRSALLDLLGS